METEKMRKLYVIGFLLLAGCQSVLGPFEHRKPERVDDPLFSISEQQRRGRDRLGLPDDTGLAPNTGVVSPTPHGH
jgi:hypothetical protein